MTQENFSETRTIVIDVTTEAWEVRPATKGRGQKRVSDASLSLAISGSSCFQAWRCHDLMYVWSPVQGSGVLLYRIGQGTCLS